MCSSIKDRFRGLWAAFQVRLAQSSVLSTQSDVVPSEEDVGSHDHEESEHHGQYVILYKPCLQQPKRLCSKLNHGGDAIHRAVDGIEVEPARALAALHGHVTRPIDRAIDHAVVI